MNFLKHCHLTFPSHIAFAQIRKAALFSNVLPCKDVSFGTYSTFEYLAVAMKPPNSCLMVIIYHSPQNRLDFISEFCEFLSNIVTNYDFILICGDFNIHIDNTADCYAMQFTDQSQCLRLHSTFLYLLTIMFTL